MTITVGSVTVRRLPTAERLPSGVLRPRLFRGDLRGCQDWYDQLWLGRRLERSGRLLWAQGVPARWTDPEQIAAQKYAEACRELDHSPAGAVARELLLDFLSPSQRDQALRFHYFDAGIHNRALARRCLELDWPVRLSVLRFRFRRDFPNGNIVMSTAANERYQLCLHPVVPYPTDDIILGQLAMLLLDPEDFISKANITPLGDSPPLHPDVQLFGSIKRHRKLVLPVHRSRINA